MFRLQPGSRSRHALFLLLILSACYAAVCFFRTATSTLGVAIMQDFEVGGGLLAVMSSAYFYPYGLMQIPAGILSDRWGTRKTLTVFLLLGGAGSLLFALSTSVATATLGRIIVGAGMGVVFVPALKVILHWFPPIQHALGTGLLISFGSVGMLVATYPLMLLSEAIGWRESLYIATGVTVLLAAMAWIFVKNRPEDAGYTVPWHTQGSSHAPRSVPPMRQTLRRVFRSRTYWSVSVWLFCMYGSFYAITGLWAGPYFIQGYGIDPGTTGMALFCLALGAVVGPSVAGCVAAWTAWPKRTLLITSCCGTVLFAVPFLLDSPCVTPTLIPLWMGLFGMMCGGFGGIALSKAQEDFPPEIAGTAIGMINTHSYIGATVLQLLSGWIMEEQRTLQSAYTLSQYSEMFVLFVVLFIAALIASLCCPRTAAHCSHVLVSIPGPVCAEKS